MASISKSLLSTTYVTCEFRFMVTINRDWLEFIVQKLPHEELFDKTGLFRYCKELSREDDKLGLEVWFDNGILFVTICVSNDKNDLHPGYSMRYTLINKSLMVRVDRFLHLLITVLKLRQEYDYSLRFRTRVSPQYQYGLFERYDKAEIWRLELNANSKNGTKTSDIKLSYGSASKTLTPQECKKILERQILNYLE